jgi:hypothetical protein
MQTTPILAVLALLLAAAVCPADEVDDLVSKLEPPARFQAHVPRWSVRKAEFTFAFMDGPQTWPFWVVMDGEGHVALIPTVGFHTGTIYVQDFQSNAVTAADGWQKVHFGFTTPKWGPFIQLAFHAENCTVYLDDFRFAAQAK